MNSSTVVNPVFGLWIDLWFIYIAQLPFSILLMLLFIYTLAPEGLVKFLESESRNSPPSKVFATRRLLVAKTCANEEVTRLVGLVYTVTYGRLAHLARAPH